MPDYKAEAAKIATAHGLDPHIFVRQIGAESGFNPNARSPAGASGIAQFIPSTAKQYGVDVSDPISSLNGAARLMRNLLRQNGGDYRKALSAYNSGRPDGYLHINETRNYVQKILGGAEPIAATAKSTPGTATSAPAATGPAVTPDGQTRSALLQQYLATRGQPGSVLSLAQGLGSLAAPVSAAAGAPSAAPVSAGTGAADTSAKGTVLFGGKTVAAWIAPALQAARQNGWKGAVTSGYRSFADQTRIYNSGVRPAAKPGTSNHEGTTFPRGAVDVTDPQGLSRALQNTPYARKLQWAGGKDPVHFSHPENGHY